MIIGQVPTAGPQSASGSQGAAGDASGANGSGFGPMLVSQVGANANANAHASSGQTAGQLAAAGLVSGDLAALLSGSSDEGMSAKLDELLGLLQEGGTELQLNEEAMLQLEQTLNELQTMMLGLFGVTLFPNAMQQDQASPAMDGESGGEAKAGKIDLLELAETLSFLKGFLQEGQVKSMGKQQSAQFHMQLDQMKHILQNGTAQPETGFTLAGETAEAPAASGANPPSTLLNRLGGQPLHPSVLQVVVAEAHTEQQAQAGAASQPIEAAGNGTWNAATPVAETAKAAEAPKPTAQPPVPVSRFAELMTGMAVKQFGLTQNNGVSEARITLLPEHLGQVDVKISVHNGQLTAQFVTDNAAAREMLENQLAVLRNSLQSQGLQVEKLEVTHNPFQSEAFQEQQRGRGNSGQSSQEQGRNGGGADDSAAAFESELLEKVVMDGLGYGRGINVTA